MDPLKICCFLASSFLLLRVCKPTKRQYLSYIYNMKKLYILFLLTISSLGSYAQSFSASNVYVSGNALFMLEGHATITNNSGSTKDVLVQRTVNNLYPGHIGYFCWFECYGQTVSLSPDVMTIPAGGSTSIFKAYVETSSISGISINNYCFFDAANTGDSVCVEYIFDATTGIEDIPAGKNFISKPYPNPASSTTSFYVNYNRDSKNPRIKLFNMLGAEVKDFAVTENKNSIKINVSDLKPGIYFYSLYLNGKNTSTGKMMVARD